jgi:hypothetical protein
MNSASGGMGSRTPSRNRSQQSSGYSGTMAHSLDTRTVRPSRRRGMATCESCVQHQGRPYRVLYAFDPRRAAILLIGGDKTGNERWYGEFIPVADRLYDAHLVTLKREGLI